MTRFMDARTDDVGETLDASICIIGAGAAGITLARELSKTIAGVLLIEAGDLQIDGETQGLFAGRQIGLRYHNLISCRLRYFGGTTNHWSGYCRANDPIDYEGRAELNLPRWPVDGQELGPYIKEAGATLNVDSVHFDPRATLNDRGLNSETLAEDQSSILQTKIFQLSNRLRLGPLYHDVLSEQRNLRTVLNLNLTHIQLAAHGRHICHIECKTLNDKTVRVTAKTFVLCCHAIENARQLLIANDVVNTGIGNAGDHVGRYFMDHIYVRASNWIPSAFFPRIYDRQFASKTNLNANISFTDSHIRGQSLLQYYCRFNPVYISNETFDALRSVQAGAFRPGDLSFLRDVGRIAGEAVGSARLMLSRTGWAYAAPDYFSMEHRLEQAPNPLSRILISDRKDALATPIADLDWRVTEDDLRSFRVGQAEVARELAALGWGRFQEEEITMDLVKERIVGHYHQIGTTRMSDDPRDGVVDRDCKVHGVENLYIGGSSVFPSAGYSGPTMMIIAFALRLSTHLKQKFV